MRPPNMKLYCHDPGVGHLSLKGLVIWSERGNRSGLFQEAFKQPKAREAFCASVFAGRGWCAALFWRWGLQLRSPSGTTFFPALLESVTAKAKWAILYRDTFLTKGTSNWELRGAYWRFRLSMFALGATAEPCSEPCMELSRVGRSLALVLLRQVQKTELSQYAGAPARLEAMPH